MEDGEVKISKSEYLRLCEMEKEFVKPSVPDMTSVLNGHMITQFFERTERHRSLVAKYLRKAAPVFISPEDAVSMGKNHDSSKYVYPELIPYVLINRSYFLKDAGLSTALVDQFSDQMNEATLHHIVHNPHHPEYWCPEVPSLNRKNRDEVPDRIVDATKMERWAMVEMVADWCAMSEERGTSPFDWYNKNVGKRWKFTTDQCTIIHMMIVEMWDDTEVRRG